MELLIEAEKDRQYQLLPNPSLDLPDDLVAENRSYRLRLVGFSPKDNVAGCQLLLGDVSQGAGRYERANELSWDWDVQDYVGRITACLERADGAAIWPVQEVIVDPHRHKLTRGQFAAMIADINAEATIAYSLSPATQQTELSQYRQCLGLAQLEYIRQQIEPLRRVIEAIACRPRRVLKQEDECVELSRARAADDRSLDWLLTHPDNLVPVNQANVPAGARDLHRQMAGYLPARIRITRRLVSYDVYENRLIKHFLQRLSTVLRHTQARLAETEQDRDNVEEPIRRLAHRRLGELSSYRHTVYNLLGLDFLQEVGPLRRFRPVTQVLRRDPFYARFYTLYQQFERAITPFEGAPFQLSLEKTWQLYEYWCFFQIISALRTLVGDALEFDAGPLLQTHTDRVSLTLPRAEVQINQRLCVFFQKSYTYYDRNRVGSYSHTMRPDISIEVYNGDGYVERIILLDPKYRVSGRSINQAMDDLHRYKDAIVGPDGQRLVTTALVLCPDIGRASSRYSRGEYIRAHGLGAVALSPGDGNGSDIVSAIVPHLREVVARVKRN
jgi:predicted component of viral defense system (DUF524 family)